MSRDFALPFQSVSHHLQRAFLSVTVIYSLQLIRFMLCQAQFAFDRQDFKLDVLEAESKPVLWASELIVSSLKWSIPTEPLTPS